MVAIRTLLVYLMLKPMLKHLAHNYKRKKFEKFYQEKALFLSIKIAARMPFYFRQFADGYSSRQVRLLRKGFTAHRVLCLDFTA